jgi:hypothetical protein
MAAVLVPLHGLLFPENDIYSPATANMPNLAAGFSVEQFIKKMGIALAESEKKYIALPDLRLGKQFDEVVRAQGNGHKGEEGLMLALEELSNAKR